MSVEFDPELTASPEYGIFGVPCPRDQAQLVLIPVPWDVTASNKGGASRGPEAVLATSPQLDLFDPELGDPYKKGIHMLPVPSFLQEKNDRLRPQATHLMEELETYRALHSEEPRQQVNRGCQEMCDWVYETSRNILNNHQIPAVLGGDHSSPLGVIQALSEQETNSYGILHIDAHADLRKCYQGFTHSHASIMDNVLQLTHPPETLIQVGVRDLSRSEYDRIHSDKRLHCAFDRDLNEELFQGTSWNTLCQKLTEKLPDHIYISLDIDGLSPELCPNTGTAVPGGLSFNQVVHLLSWVAKQGKTVIGFDLCEVAPGAHPNGLDATVGAHLLYKLCGHTFAANS